MPRSRQPYPAFGMFRDQSRTYDNFCIARGIKYAAQRYQPGEYYLDMLGHTYRSKALIQLKTDANVLGEPISTEYYNNLNK